MLGRLVPLRLQTLPLGLEPVDFDWNCLHIFQKRMAHSTRTNASGMGMWECRECHCSAQLGPWRAGWCLECRKGPHQTHEQLSKGSSQTGQTKELYYCILLSPSTTIPTNPSMNANSATTSIIILTSKWLTSLPLAEQHGQWCQLKACICIDQDTAEENHQLGNDRPLKISLREVLESWGERKLVEGWQM